MSDILTRDEVEKALNVYAVSDDPVEAIGLYDDLMAHDAAQRATIEEQNGKLTNLCHAYGKLIERLDLKREIEALEAQRSNFHVDAPIWRGVEPDEVCQECGGSGTKTYANTSTYHYSAGGQSITLSVCDKCWGSGNKDRSWPSWKQQAQEIERLKSVTLQQNKRYNDLEDSRHEALNQLAAMTQERDTLKKEMDAGKWMADTNLQIEAARLRARVRELEEKCKPGAGAI